MRLILGILALVTLSVTFAACGDDDDDDSAGTTTQTGAATTAAAGETIDIELLDFSVIAQPDTVSEGEVTFSITNSGPEHAHEFVLIKTELDAADLPTEDDGSVSEEGEGLEVIDEVEEIEPDGTATLTVDLDPGHYALICNVVDEEMGETFIHYARGMYTDFTVD